MKRKESVKIGEIGVDAGLVWIGDPCYILHKGEDFPPELGKSWDEFCDIVLGKEPSSGPTVVDFDGLGVVASTGYGDGTYPVFAEFEDGRVKKITIEFF